MLRGVLTAYMAFVLAAGPGACCCTVARQSTTPAPAPEQLSCCHGRRGAGESDRGPGRRPRFIPAIPSELEPARSVRRCGIPPHQGRWFVPEEKDMKRLSDLLVAGVALIHVLVIGVALSVPAILGGCARPAGTGDPAP